MSAGGNPAVSVVMCVYNAAADVRGAMDSVLVQSFRDFEFIIMDDGSRDDTPAILAEYAAKDVRIVLLRQENTGLTIALNNAIRHARGALIARQDADDISYPDRLAVQVSAMAARPDFGLVGAACDDLYPDGRRGLWRAHGEDDLQRIVFLQTPFAHSTAMMRTEMLRALGGYDESFRTAQDMELWMRFAKAGRIGMIDKPLILRNVAEGSISARRKWRQARDGMRARLLHAPWSLKPLAVYHGARSLAIRLLPGCVFKYLLDGKSRRASVR